MEISFDAIQVEVVSGHSFEVSERRGLRILNAL
jgi:hypothetical protein